MSRESTEKELLKKLAEVEELKNKLNKQTNFKGSEKKKRKWPFVLGGVFALLFIVANLPTPEPLTPEELAEKEAQEEAFKAEAKAKRRDKDIKSALASLETAVAAKNNSQIIKSYETLRGLDKNAVSSFSAEYEVAKAKAEEAARIRKLNNLGNFYIGNYVDDFGDSTGSKFIGYKGSGTFSNSATEGSRLSFWIAIDGPTDFDISLYEYAGKNPVKDIFGGDAFVMRFRYSDITGEVTCKNAGDRISCGPTNSARLVDALKQAGQLKFSIYNQRTTSSQYSFVVNANGFSNALRKLQE